MLSFRYDACGELIGEAVATSATPQIIGQPVDQLVRASDFASFSVVVAVTSGVTFQWAFNGTDITGATGDSLLLTAVSCRQRRPVLGDRDQQRGDGDQLSGKTDARQLVPGHP